jgi:hypothetical protein
VIERARRLSFADAISLTAVGLCAAGTVVTGDGLVAAAQRSPSAATMSWHDRLLLGLWTFRLEHALWFTLGLVLLWVGLGLGGRLGRHTEVVERVVGGVAIGYLLLAAAVLAGSTVVALAGSVGAGSFEVGFSGRERAATLLLQAATAVAMATAWALAASRLGERLATSAAERVDEDLESDEFDRFEPIDAPPGDEAAAAPLAAPSAAGAAPPALDAGAAAAVDARRRPSQGPTVAEPATPATRARMLYSERLNFSPMRDEARALVERVVDAERAGRMDEASSLADRLASM